MLGISYSNTGEYNGTKLKLRKTFRFGRIGDKKFSKSFSKWRLFQRKIFPLTVLVKAKAK